MRRKRLLVLFLLLLLLSGTFPLRVSAQPTGKVEGFALKDGDRVVFLGNSLFESDHSGYLEMALTTRWPEKKMSFRNLGWEGDNVLGQARSHFTNPPTAYETLIQQITDAEPTVLFIAYGGVEAQNGADGLEEFKSGLNALIDKGEELLATVILVSPIPVFPGIPEEIRARRNEDLKKYAAAVGEVARLRGKGFVDFYQPLWEAQSHLKLSDDGIHLNETGYYVLASSLLNSLGKPLSEQILSVRMNKKGVETGSPILVQPSEEGLLNFTIEEERLPLIVPTEQLRNSSTERVLRVEGLKKGYYTLLGDGMPVATCSAKEWAKGVSIQKGPLLQQAELLRFFVTKKNFLFCSNTAHGTRPILPVFVPMNKGGTKKDWKIWSTSSFGWKTRFT